MNQKTRMDRVERKRKNSKVKLLYSSLTWVTLVATGLKVLAHLIAVLSYGLSLFFMNVHEFSVYIIKLISSYTFYDMRALKYEL